MIREFIWWYGWQLDYVTAFCLNPQTEMRTLQQLYQGLIVVFGPVVLAAVVGYYLGAHFGLKKPKETPNILDEGLEKTYALRVVYMFPPNKERISSKYIDEQEGKDARFTYSHHQPFSKHGVNWYIVADYISGCKGSKGNTELRIVHAQPIATPENFQALEVWTGKVTYKQK